jgi:hypothetical protein
LSKYKVLIEKVKKNGAGAFKNEKRLNLSMDFSDDLL